MHSLIRFLWLWALAGALHSGAWAESGQWKKVTAPEGVVFRNDLGAWRSQVEPARGRLTFLGAIDGPNLLSRPASSTFVEGFGGHRFWLGPLTAWPRMWPPPDAWEKSAAADIRGVGTSELTLMLAENRELGRILSRSYRWRAPGRLECAVSWVPAISPPPYALQILQLNRPSQVLAQPVRSKGVPQGYVILPLASREKIQTRFATPANVSPVREGLLLSCQKSPAKFGFLSQSLMARWDGTLLTFRTHSWSGREIGRPDLNCLSQVYLGPKTKPVWEIEQLSPRLASEGDEKPVTFTVMIELSAAP